MKAASLSTVLQFIIRELLDAILRPLWLSDINSFQATLDATDCYPFRVCYELGRCKQMWMEAPGEELGYDNDFGLDEDFIRGGDEAGNIQEDHA